MTREAAIPLSTVPLALEPLMKGVPPEMLGLSREDIAATRFSVINKNVPLPAAILKRSVLQQNSRWMRDYVAQAGASIAPHGKTSMSPELFELQQRDGCWGLTLASYQQVRVARHYGVSRIILANEAIGELELDYYLEQIRDDSAFDFYCYVDSEQGVRKIIQQARSANIGRPLNLLLELGYAGGRAGCRSLEDALRVAHAVQEGGDCIQLRGVSGFEGLYQGLKGEDRLTLVEDFLKLIVKTAFACDEAKLFGAGEILLSAGGSSYYDVVTRMFGSVRLSGPVRVVTRSGCYLTHDSGMYRELQSEVLARDGHARHLVGHLDAALEVWAQVLSIPEPELIVVSAGKRDFGIDAGMPVPVRLARMEAGLLTLPPGCVVVAVSDHHAHIKVPMGHQIRHGDLIGLGVSHPCTTFDKWRVIYMVNDDYTIVDIAQTHF